MHKHRSMHSARPWCNFRSIAPWTQRTQRIAGRAQPKAQGETIHWWPGGSAKRLTLSDVFAIRPPIHPRHMRPYIKSCFPAGNIGGVNLSLVLMSILNRRNFQVASAIHSPWNHNNELLSQAGRRLADLFARREHRLFPLARGHFVGIFVLNSMCCLGKVFAQETFAREQFCISNVQFIHSFMDTMIAFKCVVSRRDVDNEIASGICSSLNCGF
jgi:hypothetical protein